MRGKDRPNADPGRHGGSRARSPGVAGLSLVLALFAPRGGSACADHPCTHAIDPSTADIAILGADRMQLGVPWASTPSSSAWGDLNDDGVADYVAKARPDRSDLPTGAGGLVVLAGPFPSGTRIDLAADEPLVRLVGASEDDDVGHLVGTGDLNGDGIDDLATYVQARDVRRNWMGVWFGPWTEPTQLELAVDPPDLAIRQDMYAWQRIGVGKQVLIGDLNGDGQDDLVFGQPWEEHSPPLSSGGTGVIRVLFGPFAAGQIDIRSETGDFFIYGRSERCTLSGNLLASFIDLADITGDGVLDLITSTTCPATIGSWLVFPGPLAAGSIDLDLQAAPITILNAPMESGTSGPVTVGDFDGDGYTDLAATGARRLYDDGRADFAGIVRVVFGPFRSGDRIDLSRSGRTWSVANRTRFNARLQVARGGDLDADGIDELIVLDPAAALPGGMEFGFGSVHVIAGPLARGEDRELPDCPGQALAHGLDDRYQAGKGGAWAEDLDGDGTVELVVASLAGSGHAETRTEPGDLLAFDICDISDPDRDGVPGWVDLCPTVFDPEQGDEDGDGLGDACDLVRCVDPPPEVHPRSLRVTRDPSDASGLRVGFDTSLLPGFADHVAIFRGVLADLQASRTYAPELLECELRGSPALPSGQVGPGAPAGLYFTAAHACDPVPDGVAGSHGRQRVGPDRPERELGAVTGACP